MAYKADPVEFPSQGVTLRGKLFTPESGGKNGKFPAISIIGPILSIKEQAPIQYATRLAQHGFVTLIWDARTLGESDGEPRQFESLSRKMEDMSASIDYLQSLAQVDKERIGLIGICQGANVVIGTAAQDSRVKALAPTCGNYVCRENAMRLYGNDAARLDARIAKADEAKRKFEANGEVEYGMIIQPDQNAKLPDPLLPHPPPWMYYHQWLPHTAWKNQYTIMTEAETWRFDVREVAKQVKQPYLVVHSEFADMGPTFAYATFDNIASTDKSKHWLGKAGHIEFYENPVVIDAAVMGIKAFFQRVLA